MSRKTLVFIIGIFTALLTFFQNEFGLTISAVSVGAAMLALANYVHGEMKLDLAKIKGAFQSGRWKDPKFYTSLLAAMIPILSEQFGWNIGPDTIAILSGFLTLILGVIFKAKEKKLLNS